MHQTALPRDQTSAETATLDRTEGPRTRTYGWDDPSISAAAARELDGAGFLNAILDGSLPAAPIARTLDFRPVSMEPGTAVFVSLERPIVAASAAVCEDRYPWTASAT